LEAGKLESQKHREVQKVRRWDGGKLESQEVERLRRWDGGKHANQFEPSSFLPRLPQIL
jgi:hypothetical protein